MSRRTNEDWTTLMARYRGAQVARDVMRNPEAAQIDRDQAAIRYSRALDGVLEVLERLSEAGILGRIALFLARAVP